MSKRATTNIHSQTDWARIKAMKDDSIDTSEIPELRADFFESAIEWPGPKKQITLRLDPDVLTFFKGMGRGYQRTMNNVLRSYMSHRRAHSQGVAKTKASRKKGS
jgi:uncharacterized protein (DUF4415 family)